MDYSLLIGIKTKEVQVEEVIEEEYFNSRNLQEPQRILSLTIIDYLQEYDLSKKIEGCLKIGQ